MKKQLLPFACAVFLAVGALTPELRSTSPSVRPSVRMRLRRLLRPSIATGPGIPVTTAGRATTTSGFPVTTSSRRTLTPTGLKATGIGTTASMFG